MCPKYASLLIALTLMVISPSQAFAAICSGTVCYVTEQGGTGTRTGATWSSALSASDLVSGSMQNVPRSNLKRGATYYFAAGSYGSIVFADAENGTNWIRLLKATAENSGNVSGWQSSFAGPAIFSFLIFATDYYELNGLIRDETTWDNGPSYGFRITSGTFAHGANFPPGGDNIIIKYCNIGRDGGGYTSGMAYGVQAWYGRHHWSITHNYFHHGLIPVHMVDESSNITVDRNFMGPSWGKETIMALYGGSNWVVSNNILMDTCQSTGTSDSACTTEISGYDNYATAYDNWEVFGNIIYRKDTKTSPHTAAAIYGGAAGIPTNWRVYNNVIAGFAVPEEGVLQRAGIIVNGPSAANNRIYNNIWYDIGHIVTGSDPGMTVEVKCTAGGAESACEKNWCLTGNGSNCGNIGSQPIIGTSSPFVDYPGFNFRLSASSSARNAGKNLTGITGFAAGLSDRYGQQRGQDGAWDIGAYEFVGGGSPPAPPSGLQIGP